MNTRSLVSSLGPSLVLVSVVLAFQNCSRLSSGISTQESTALPNATGTGPDEVTSPAPAVTPTPLYFGRFEFVSGTDHFGRDYGQNQNRARFDWSGSSVQVSFTGSELRVALKSPLTQGNGPIYFISQVDDLDPLRFATATDTNETVYVLARGLDLGPIHRVTLMRESESANGTTEFLGFDVSADGRFVPSSAQAGPRLEVIGDSITCGYGNEGQSPCGYSTATQSARASYAQVAARRLGSVPATQICQSGIGVTRTYGEASGNGRQMPFIYPYTRNPLFETSPAPWAFTDPAPEFVVVNLGTNDFWDGTEPTTYESDLTAFLRFVRGKHPRAFLIAAIGPMRQQPEPAIKSVVQNLQVTDARLSFLPFAPMQAADGVGCDGHPTTATHEKMGAQLAQKVTAITTIRALYLRLLRREPDVAGYDYYTDRLDKGDTAAMIERQIRASDEYKSTH